MTTTNSFINFTANFILPTARAKFAARNAARNCTWKSVTLQLSSTILFCDYNVAFHITWQESTESSVDNVVNLEEAQQTIREIAGLEFIFAIACPSWKRKSMNVRDVERPLPRSRDSQTRRKLPRRAARRKFPRARETLEISNNHRPREHIID